MKQRTHAMLTILEETAATVAGLSLWLALKVLT